MLPRSPLPQASSIILHKEWTERFCNRIHDTSSQPPFRIILRLSIIQCSKLYPSQIDISQSQVRPKAKDCSAVVLKPRCQSQPGGPGIED